MHLRKVEKPVLLDVDAEISRLEREVKEREEEIVVLKRLRARDLERHAPLEDTSISLPSTNGGNPAFTPKGTIPGREGAIRYLRLVGKQQPVVEIHRAAQKLGADITYGTMYSILVEDSRRGKNFTRGPKRGHFGLLE